MSDYKENATEQKKKNETAKYLKALIVCILLVVTFWLCKKINYSAVQTYMENHFYSGCLFGIFLYALFGCTPIPSEPLTVIFSTIYGPFNASIICIFGNTVAAILEFFIGGSIGNLADFEEKKKKLPLNLGKLPASSPLFLIGARMIPGIGPKFVSLAAGMYKVPFANYVFAMIISNALGAFPVAFAGHKILSFF